jgi:hypothetical protein
MNRKSASVKAVPVPSLNHSANSSLTTSLLAVLVLIGTANCSRAADRNLTDEFPESACVVNNRKAIELMNREQLGQATAILNQILRHTGDTPEDRFCRSVSLTNLADSALRAGNLRDASKQASEAVELARNRDGAPNALLYQPTLILAQVAVQQRHQSEALPLLQELDSIPGASARDLAVRFGVEASLMAERGEFKDAETPARRSVQNWRRAGLYDTLDAVPAQSHLAMICLRRGHTSGSVTEIEDCVRVLDEFEESDRSRGHASYRGRSSAGPCTARVRRHPFESCGSATGSARADAETGRVCHLPPAGDGVSPDASRRTSPGGRPASAGIRRRHGSANGLLDRHRGPEKGAPLGNRHMTNFVASSFLSSVALRSAPKPADLTFSDTVISSEVKRPVDKEDCKCNRRRP